jgi:hypothetical protein
MVSLFSEQPAWGAGLLFSAKISRNLSPFVGLPFNEPGRVTVFSQPLFCAVDVFEQFLAFAVSR